MQQLEYSIIVPTYNRIDEIEPLLKSISNLNFDFSKLEVLIVDDGSTDNTEDFVKQYGKSSDFSLKYFKQKNQGPAAARNLGMKNTESPFFIFVDSDVTLPQDWLSIVDKDLKENNADAFGGPDTFRKDFPPLLKAINYSMTSFFTTGGMRGKKGKKLAKYYPRSFNMGLSRKTYEKIGPFYPLRHGQDIEFSHRIIESGAKVLYIDSPVFHKRRTSIKKFFKQVFNWGVARINLYKIDKKMLEVVHVLPSLGFIFTVLFLLSYLFCPPCRGFLTYCAYFAAFYLTMIAAFGGWKYKSLKVFGLLFIIAPIQVLGYGIGLVYNTFRRLVFKKGETAGITRNYYG